MTKKAIILAASQGHGFNGHDVPAPLMEVGGSSLIKRSLQALTHHGITDVVVVVGYRGEEIRRCVSSDPEIIAHIRWVDLPEGDRGDARSLIMARAHVDEPAVVMRTQLLFAPEILVPLLDHEGFPGESTLLVDRKLSRIYDLAGATKLQTLGDRVVQMSTDLADFDAVSLGITALMPQFLHSIKENGSTDVSLGSLLQKTILQGRVRTLDVNGSQWQEISSPETRLHAEWLMQAYGEQLSGHAPSPKKTKIPGDANRTLSYIEGLLSEKSARHYVLFNPGPVLTSPRVKSALVHHDVSHRDSDYSAVLRRLERKLRRVCKGGSHHDIVLFSGSGTASMEAVVSSCIPQDKKLLVVSNGAFGERFTEIADVHGIQTVHLKYKWGRQIDPDDVLQALDANPDIVATIMCHHETSVGILNPVRLIGKICRERDLMFFVDAVSSLGGEDIDMRRDQIDILISSANKCLHAISGVSFVCVDRRIWSRIEHIPPRVYYLDLKRYHHIHEELAQTPFTPAVSNYFALDAALDELLQVGVEGRIQHYRKINRRIRRSLRRMGLGQLTNTGNESHTITTVKVPSYISFTELYEELKKRGYIIYDCKEHLKDRYFQIANMGDLSDEMVQGLLDTLEHVLEWSAVRQRKEPEVLHAPN